MLTFAWPWLFVLLPLPLLIRLLLKPSTNTAPALKANIYSKLAAQQISSPSNHRSPLLWALLLLMWLALVSAATRPQWLGEPIEIPVTGRDLLLAVDISVSMATRDMILRNKLYPRITVVKDVVSDFVERRTGDKLGLILFGSDAYLQTPLTFDRATLNSLLQEAKIGYAGRATAIGDAIGIAIKRLESRPDNSRVLILLSDGADTASELPPRKAAELAAQHSIRIYTIGIGTDTVNASNGLDEATLTAIANITGGQYFRARDPKQLKAIYLLLDSLEPVAQEQNTLRPTKALFYWPLAIAFILMMLLLSLHTLRRQHD